MEGNGFSERIYSNAMFGLSQNPQIQQLQKHPQQQMISSTQQLEQQTQLSMKQPSNYIPYNNPNLNPNLKTKSQMTNSDEDEPGNNDIENNSIDGKRKVGNNNNSPWQRMKWTDNMVRLLIMAVYYIGDEAGNDASGQPDKKKPGPSGSTGLLQKKGKWKSVSRAMMEKGFYVSPQQCEDKFNDLNKRYKRVNDILGKGTACNVVENQSLLETMDLSPKMKEEVRKLLNSKHLFFREMCAYHNSCGHGGSNPVQNNPVQAEPVQTNPVQLRQQSCSHLGAMAENNGEHKINDVDDDDDDDEDDYDDDFDDDFDDYHDDDTENPGGRPRKRARVVGWSSQALQQLSVEVVGVLQDGGRTSLEKRKWIRDKLANLEEEKLKFQIEKLEMEKQKMKWLRYCERKGREMEMLKLDHDRKAIDHERLVLLVKQKEIELCNEIHAPNVAN